ncbi:MAG TPA: hypothetical protein EYQ20_04455 [candidate division Zixibacteria bacterium]|nr:hypothetical protein [candidate division Zixibacteria bacterium]
MAVNEIIQTVLEQLRKIADTEVHVGKPLQVGETFVIPVSKISLGFGAGGFGVEGDQKQGSGTGGGVSIEPVAFLVIRGENAQLLHLNSPGSPMGKLLEIMPEVIEQVKDYMDREDRYRGAGGREQVGPITKKYHQVMCLLHAMGHQPCYYAGFA